MLKLEGAVEQDIALLFQEQLSSLTEDDKPVEIDLQKADFITQRALDVVVASIRNVHDQLGPVTLRHAPERITRALSSAGVRFTT